MAVLLAPLARAAILGTGRNDPRSATLSNDAEALVVRQAGPVDRARQILLQAGAHAVYQRAGRLADIAPTLPASAPVDTMPVCSPGAADLIAGMLQGHGVDLIPEALERIRQARVRLPHALLPVVLSEQEPARRLAVLSMLGERGRWLAQFNPRWGWVSEANITNPADVPADAETVWHEGSAAQRLFLLQHIRAVDPALARAWIEGVWKEEKAEFRKDLVEALASQLSSDDEPFLEIALGDRSQGVQEAAIDLLRRLGDSALIKRMQARADTMLSYAQLNALVTITIGGKRLNAGQLCVIPPRIEDINRQWQRDGISRTPLRNTGDRVDWLKQVLSFVPPSYWEQRFRASPAELIDAVRANEWRVAVLEGWGTAVAYYGHGHWALPLLTWFCAAREAPDYVAKPLINGLMRLLSRDQAEQFIVAMLAKPGNQKPCRWAEALSAWAEPWSVEFGSYYLAALRAPIFAVSERHPRVLVGADWGRTLYRASHALPSLCFECALQPLPLNFTPTDAFGRHSQRQIDAFHATIRARQRLAEEIPL